MSLYTAIADFLLKIPPYVIINPDEGGVFLRGGKYRRSLSEGFYWKWPIYDNIQKIAIKEQVINLPEQSVKTKDDHTMAVSGVIKYEVADVRKTILEVFEYDSSLQNLALGVIASYISHVPLADCVFDEIQKEVLEELQIEAEGWGLDILDFRLTDFAQHRVFRLMTHSIPRVTSG